MAVQCINCLIATLEKLPLPHLLCCWPSMLGRAVVPGHTWSRLPWSCLFLADLRLEPSWEDELPPDIRRFLRLYKRVPVSE